MSTGVFGAGLCVVNHTPLRAIWMHCLGPRLETSGRKTPMLDRCSICAARRGANPAITKQSRKVNGEDRSHSAPPQRTKIGGRTAGTEHATQSTELAALMSRSPTLFNAVSPQGPAGHARPAACLCLEGSEELRGSISYAGPRGTTPAAASDVASSPHKQVNICKMPKIGRYLHPMCCGR